MRQAAVEALGAAIPFAPDINQVWIDLGILLSDDDWIVKGRTIEAIGKTFSYMPDKNLAWNTIYSMAYDPDKYVRWKIAQAIGEAFQDLPNKAQAWDSLIGFVEDVDGNVQEIAARALSFAFAFSTRIPNTNKTLQDLHKLTHHSSNYVRMYAYYCLGRGSISEATNSQDEDEFKKKLENALEFFEEAYHQSIYHNPAKFCLPFYRSFYTLTFKEGDAEKEIRTYISDAKEAAEGSKSKEILLKAVTNLSSALLEVKSLREADLNIVKGDLRIYKLYCEHAADLLASSENEAPIATKLILKGLPIIDRRIRTILSEIREETRNFCKSSRDSPFEEIGEGAFNFTKRLDSIEDKESARRILIDLIIYLQPTCMFLPESSKNLICGQLNNIEKSDIKTISVALKNALIALNMLVSSQKEQIDYLKNIIDARLKIINYDIFRIKISSGDIASNLRAVKTEADEIKSIKNSLNAIGSSVQNFEDSLDQYFLISHSDIDQLVDQIEKIVADRTETPQTKSILDRLMQMKKSKREILFDRIVSLSSIIGLVLTILQIPLPKS